MTSPEIPNATRWIGPVLCCAVPDPDAYEGLCGLPIESEPCPRHGTTPPPWPAESFCPHGWPNAASRCTCGCEENEDA